MKNLFVVNTPFHLLQFFILSQTVCKHDENYLALVRPSGYDAWHKERLMEYLTSVDAGWKEVFPLNNWLSSKKMDNKAIRRQVEQVREVIGRIGIEEVFLCCDANLYNQLLVATLKLGSFWRGDDGIYSYYTEKRRSTSHRIFHQLKARYLKLVWGIRSDLPINTGTDAQNPAAKGDFLYLPKLLLRPSPCVREITTGQITEAMAIIEKTAVYRPRYCAEDASYAMYLSQGLLAVEKEVEILERLRELMPDKVLIYKPHPNDSPDKLSYIGCHLSDIQLCDSKIPVEVMLYFEPKIKTVIAYQSTPLILAKKFTGREIECISIAKLYLSRPMNPIYVDMMKKMQVRFVEP